MIDWVARITKVYTWTNNLEDEDMADSIRMLCVELERTLLDENAEKMREKLWGAIRAIASKSPLWPQRRELE